jgi:restriction system protein
LGKSHCSANTLAPSSNSLQGKYIIFQTVEDGSESSVGDPIVSALYGKVAPAEFGLLVALGTFTNQAKSFARSKSNLRLIDGVELVELILQHYDQLDSQYKGMIPLKKVFVPQPIGDELE